MSVTARDLFFVLRVRDEATSVLANVSRDILRVGAAAQASSMKARAAALRQQAANIEASMRAEVAADRFAAAELRRRAATLRASGATATQTNGLLSQARAYERHAQIVTNAARRESTALRQQAVVIDGQVSKLEASAAAHQRYANALRSTSNALTITGLAFIGVGIAALAALGSTVQYSQEYQRQVALTKTQVDGFAVSLAQLSQLGKNVARDIAVPFEEVQSSLYDIFSSTNANLKQAAILETAFAKASVAGQVSLQDASRSTMQLMNAFRIPFEDVNDVLDLQFQLVRKGVGTYAQFSTVIGRAVPSAVRAGQSLKTLDAMLVFLTRNGLSAAMASASAGRALDAMSNPKTVDRLNAMGIKVRDLKGNFLPLVDILQQLHDKLMKMPAADRVKALQDILKGSGGTIQARRFLDLVLLQTGQMENFAGFLKDMGNSSGQFTQAYNQMANSTAAKTQLLKNNFNIMKETIGEALTPIFIKVVGAVAMVVNAFNKLSPHVQKIIVLVVAGAAAFSVILGVVLLVIGAVAAIGAALAALGLTFSEVFIIVGLVVGIIVALGVALYKAYTQGGPIRKLFNDIIGFAKDVFKAMQDFGRSVVDTFNKDMRPALENLWNVIQTKVVPVLDDFVGIIRKNAMPIIRSFLADIKNIIHVGFEVLSWAINHLVIPAIKLATKYYNEHKDSIDKVVHYIMIAVKWIGIIAGGAVLGALVLVIVAVIGFFYAWIQAYIHVLEWTEKATKAFISFKDKVRNAFLTVLQVIISFFNLIVQGAAKAFGWMPGIGPKLKEAAKQVQTFANQVNAYLQGIKDTDVNIRLKVEEDKVAKEARKKGYQVIPAFATGGIVPGPAGKARLIMAHGGEEVLTPEQQKQKKGGDKTFNQTFNIYTNEIRPVATAAQLGRLFAARIA